MAPALKELTCKCGRKRRHVGIMQGKPAPEAWKRQEGFQKLECRGGIREEMSHPLSAGGLLNSFSESSSVCLGMQQ